jgi:hypothetical protein
VIRRHRARCACALLILCASTASRPAAGQASSPTEDEVKAAYLFHFAKYVEWPTGAPADTAWVVGILGDGVFSEVLERTLEGKTAKDRAFVAHRLSDPAQASQVHILFIGASEEPRLPRILKALEGSSVLTVSDIDGFAEKGGVIGFRMDGKRVRFDINPEHASRSGLRISSQLLSLARVVPAR